MTERPVVYTPNMARILVVDDEPNIRLPLVRALQLSGYFAEGVDSGAAALDRLKHATYDLMILDMQMPEMDGTAVMQHAHPIRPDLLILILTGHATLESAIVAVKSKAVDYLIKPASLKDIGVAVGNALQRRVDQLNQQRLLRTAIEALQKAETLVPAQLLGNTDAPTSKSPRPERFLQMGALTWDRDKQLAIIDGATVRTVALTKGEAVLLEILAASPDEPFSCRDLAHRAWGYDLDKLEAESVVRPYISRLRHKLEQHPDKPSMFVTVRGRGYLFTPP